MEKMTFCEQNNGGLVMNFGEMKNEFQQYELDGTMPKCLKVEP